MAGDVRGDTTMWDDDLVGRSPQADRPLGDPANVLVVCTANMARSPVATALLSAGAPPAYRFASAGIHARLDMPAVREARQIATHFGLDLSTHRSQPVTQMLVSEADLIITMSERQRDHCSRMAPTAALSTFTIRELVRLLSDDVATLDSAPAGYARVERIVGQATNNRLVSAGSPQPEDVQDPVGQGERHWAAFTRDILDLTRQLRRILAIDR